LGLFALLRPAQNRDRKVVSETLSGSFQVPFFHRSEIIRLDIGKRPIVEEIGRFPPFLR
jgi:hypothetical protein